MYTSRPFSTATPESGSAAWGQETCGRPGLSCCRQHDPDQAWTALNLAGGPTRSLPGLLRPVPAFRHPLLSSRGCGSGSHSGSQSGAVPRVSARWNQSLKPRSVSCQSAQPRRNAETVQVPPSQGTRNSWSPSIVFPQTSARPESAGPRGEPSGMLPAAGPSVGVSARRPGPAEGDVVRDDRVAVRAGDRDEVLRQGDRPRRSDLLDQMPFVPPNRSPEQGHEIADSLHRVPYHSQR